MTKKSSDKDLLLRLREFYNSHGRSPSVRVLPGGSTVEKRFGSWNAALRAAGLPINKEGRLSDKVLLKKLRAFYRQYGRSPILKEFSGGSTIEQRFGSWNKALKTAGLPLNKGVSIPDSVLQGRIRNFYRIEGRSPTDVELPGATTLLTRFKGWNNALRAAGLPVNLPKYHLTKGEVSGNTIRDTARVLYARYHGGPPKQCEVCGYSKSVMICHIKPVAKFSDKCRIEEINAKDNLIALCPNCHHELDAGLLKTCRNRASR